MRKDYDSIIIMATQGDREALGELYDDLHKGIYALALSITKSSQTAEDVVQDTFVRICSSGTVFKSRGFGKAWVYKIARNLALTTYKNAKRQVPDEDIEQVSTETTVEDSTINKVVLENALTNLSDKERQVVMLHAVAGMLHAEIASVLDIPVGTVKWRYSKAIKKLSKLV